MTRSGEVPASQTGKSFGDAHSLLHYLLTSPRRCATTTPRHGLAVLPKHRVSQSLQRFAVGAGKPELPAVNVTAHGVSNRITLPPCLDTVSLSCYAKTMAKKQENPQPEPELPEVGTLMIDENIETYSRAKAYQVWAYDDTGHMLTVEEQLFVRSYIVDRNEVAAMRRLGYSEAPNILKRRAEKMLMNPEVQGAVAILAQTMMKKLEIEAENVNRGIAAIAFTDVTEILHFDGLRNNLMASHLWPEHVKRAVSGIKSGQYGIEVKFYDKQRSLEFLSKQLGLSSDGENASAQMAEAAAALAVNKIMEVVQRKHKAIEARQTVDDADLIEVEARDGA